MTVHFKVSLATRPLCISKIYFTRPLRDVRVFFYAAGISRGSQRGKSYRSFGFPHGKAESNRIHTVASS
jgi:hypothetical protein